MSDVIIDDSIVLRGDARYQKRNNASDAYTPSDAAETDIADSDYFPFYDTSATAKRKTLWSNIVDKIKTAIWKPNTNAQEGYVASGAGQANKVWRTDASGNPGWRGSVRQAVSDVYFSGNYLCYDYVTDNGGVMPTMQEEIPALQFEVVSSLNADTVSRDGIWFCHGTITGAPATNHGMFLNVSSSSMGTPFQMYFPDNSLKIYKRWYTNGAWVAWQEVDTWRGIQNNLTSDSTTDSLSAAQGKALANGSARDSTKLPLAGGEMTGALAFANGTWNSVGDDCYMGDQNVGGAVCFKGRTGNTALRLIERNGTNGASITFNGSKIIIDTLDPYVSVSISGSTITLTKQSGGTSQVTTPNTTYSIKEYGGTPANLREFVQATATGQITTHFKFKDTNGVLGLGTNQWIKGWIQYQNSYDGAYDVKGTGMATLQDNHVYVIWIDGTASTTFTATKGQLY